jgi:hypothetical protein
MRNHSARGLPHLQDGRIRDLAISLSIEAMKYVRNNTKYIVNVLRRKEKSELSR